MGFGAVTRITGIDVRIQRELSELQASYVEERPSRAA